MNSKSVKRLMKDLEIYENDKPDGIWLWPSENNIQELYAIVVGPKDTPYADGFFFFKINVKNTYPSESPQINHITTSLRKSVRLHPNLYGTGKVCLSILGTFSGPSWSPMYNLLTIFIQIQSLLDSEPWKHEPGYEKTSKPEYCNYIDYCTLLCGVVDMMGRKEEFPEFIYEKMREHYFKNKENYLARLEKFKNDPTIKNGFIFTDIKCEYNRLLKFFQDYS